MDVSTLPAWKQDFLRACIKAKCLTFGSFTLKSGRQSPYFFNIGTFHTGSLLRSLSTAFAHAIDDHKEPSSLEFDVLFGPAYKGIPLAATTVDKMATINEPRFGDVSYAFNRKEAKAYGDGGMIVGASLKGKRVLIIDDVITAGTAIREAVEIIKAQGGTLVGIVIALNRMEKMPTATDNDGQPGPSAIGEVRKATGVPVISVLTLEDILEGLRAVGNADDFKRLDDYRSRYRASD